MIDVMLVTNDDGGLPRYVPINEETTLKQFLEVFFDGDPNDFTIRVRANGTTVDAHDDYTLQNNDRVSLAPRKVVGETNKGPGTNNEQIAALRIKLGPNHVVSAERLASNNSAGILTLACKLRRAQERQDKLPRVLTKMLNGLSEDDARIVREKLTKCDTT